MRLVNILMEYPDSTMHQVSVYSIQRTADGTLIMSYYDHGVDGNLLVDSFTPVNFELGTFSKIPEHLDWGSYNIIDDPAFSETMMNQLVSFAARNNAIKVALPKVEKATPAPALAVAASDSLLPPDPPINVNVPLESQLHATVGFASNPERGEFKPLSERVVVVLPTNPSGNYVVYYNPDPNEYCAAYDAIFFSYGDRNSFTGTKDYRNTTPEYDVVKKQNKDEVNRELLRKHIAVGDLQLVPIVPSYISPGKTFMQVGRPITVNNAEYVLLACYNMELFQELTKADGLQLDDQNNYAGHIAGIRRS